MGKLPQKIWFIEYTVQQEKPIAFGVIALPSMRTDHVSARFILNAESTAADVIRLVENRLVNKIIEITTLKLEGYGEVISD